MTRVNAAQLGTTATALSQDGTQISPYELGALPASQCGTIGGPCWAFQTRASDSTSGSTSSVKSVGIAATDHWYHLTGIRDATSNTIQLYVCDLEDGINEPILQGSTSTPTGKWTAMGSMQLGRSKTGSSYTNHWNGRIDDVRVYSQAVNVKTIRDACLDAGID